MNLAREDYPGGHDQSGWLGSFIFSKKRKKSFFSIENPIFLHYKWTFGPTVVKDMARQEFCDSCKQKNDCREVYDQLGGVEGPSVTVKVILAFLLPLVVFILFLAAFEKILAKAIGASHGLTAASLLVALLASLACIMMTGVIRRKLGQGR